MKKSTHSKIKNTVILFELLTRQVAADTIKGVEKSPALNIIREFFKADTTLAKELVLYQTLLNEKYDTTEKANFLLNSVLKLRNKLNINKLKTEKYNLIREVKKHYELSDFFKTNLTEYKLYASIYRVFEGVSISKVSDVVQSRYTILEHLNRKASTRNKNANEPLAETYSKQDEEVRLLAYKLMIDKFNEKYADLSAKQKSILREYINNVSNTTELKSFIVEESKKVCKSIKKLIPGVSDQVVVIKLKEVCNFPTKVENTKTIKEKHVLSLLLFHELLKELKDGKA